MKLRANYVQEILQRDSLESLIHMFYQKTKRLKYTKLILTVVL
jgi:hypothetical protein